MSPRRCSVFRPWFAIPFSAWALAGSAAASWAPWAETVSSLDTWIGLGGARPGLTTNTDATTTARTYTTAVTLSQTVLALQEALALPLTGSPGSVVHYAGAAIDLTVALADPAAVEGPVGPDEPLIRFGVNATTASAMSADEPVFARAGAVSEGIVDGLVVANPGTVWLDVVWDMQRLELNAVSHSALAFVTDRVEVFAVTPAGEQTIGEAGFVTSLANGNATFEIFTGTESYTAQASVGDRLVLSPMRTAVALPIPATLDTLAIRVVNTHAELSIAAAPRATVPVLAAAGSLSAPVQAAPMMHWDAAAGTLAFDPIPIVTDRGALALDPDDPLAGGRLEISGLHALGLSDGRRYFTGGTVTLRDRFGNPVLTVGLPMLVFDDSLFGYQGFAAFAPILQVLDADANRSAWIAGFLDLIAPDAPYLPELFIGFDSRTLTAALWDTSFSVPVNGLLSYAGAAPAISVPAPGTLILCGAGPILIAVRRRRLAGSPSLR